MAEAPKSQSEPDPQPVTESNTVALIGFIMLLVSVGACGLLFFLAERLPDSIDKFADVPADSPAKLALIIVGSTTAVLALVAVVLSAVGFFLPNRPRTLAVVGCIGGCVLLSGIFGVLALGILMNPTLPSDGQPPETSESGSSEDSSGPLQPEG